MGTVLGGLALAGENGGIGNILGNANGCNSPAVTERQFYETEIHNLKEGFNTTMGISDRICALEQRVAVDETSIAKNFDFMSSQNEWQNKFFDAQMKYADLLEQCRINEATCKCIKGDVYASPSQLADPYSGGINVISTRHLYPAYGYANYDACGYGSNYYNTGCGCGCGYNY